MRESGPFSSSYQRLDDAAVVDFLTSSASVLCEQGLIGDKDTDNLRMALSGIGSRGRGERNRSLLVELETEHADYLDVLAARFGPSGLCLNILRLTLRKALIESHTAVNSLGQALLKKVELLFNRPFYIYHAGHCQRQTLYSSVIVDFVASVVLACGQVEAGLNELAQMAPSDLALPTEADREVDLGLAKALGFVSLMTHSLPVFATTETKRRVAQSLSLLGDAAAQLAEQLTANTNEEAAHDVVAACEWLRLECQRLDLLELPRSESLVIWEVRRRHLIGCIYQLNDALSLVASTLLSALSYEPREPNMIITAAAHRRLVFDMIATGVAPASAKAAARGLVDYLNEKRLAPREVLPAELGRIHPSLTAKALTVLASVSNDGALMASASADKEATMRRAGRFAEALKLAALKVVAPTSFLCVFLTLSSCGLKTNPVSSISELRPDVPFRIAEPAKPVDGMHRNKDAQTGPPKAGGGPTDGPTEKQP